MTLPKAIHELEFGHGSCYGKEEQDAVLEVMRAGAPSCGPAVKRFEETFARYCGTEYGLAVSSGTTGLQLAMIAAGVGPGDEVITTPISWISTANAAAVLGAKVVFADVDARTLNLDPASVEKKITPRTRALIVVHMCGRSCEMDPILEIARKHGLKVIEDCAHAIETTYRGQPAGLMGDAGCFSFYPTKSITTGDGGMVTSRDRDLIARVKLLSYNGIATNTWTRFADGVPGYEVIAAGFKYYMTDMEAALGLPQLPLLEGRRSQRERLWFAYNKQLEGLPVVVPQTVDVETRHAYHLYTPLLQLEKLSVKREQIVAAMEAENIGVGIHYEPVHAQPYYRERLGYRDVDLPNSSYIGERTISLPLSAGMTEEDVSDVCVALGRILRYYPA